MKYRVEYREDGWFRPEGTMAEGQPIIHALNDGRRLKVLLVRFPGTTGPGKIASAGLEAMLEDQWGRCRWRSVQHLHARDIELVKASA